MAALLLMSHVAFAGGERTAGPVIAAALKATPSRAQTATMADILGTTGAA